MKMSRLHSAGTKWVRRDGLVVRDAHHPAWAGHEEPEMKRRRAHNKVAKKSRQVNYRIAKGVKK